MKHDLRVTGAFPHAGVQCKRCGRASFSNHRTLDQLVRDAERHACVPVANDYERDLLAARIVEGRG